MDKTSAKEYLNRFLEENPDFKPYGGYRLKEPFEQTIDGKKIYFVIWEDEYGNSARGGYTYYVMPDGWIMMPGGNSGADREQLESVYSRWRSQKSVQKFKK